jgi:16S rRNA (uracil1498-N3)-methyltransferase
VKQFLLPRRHEGESRLSLEGKDFHYLARVLRKREGDQMPAVDARGNLYLMRIVRMDREACEVELVAAEPPGEAAAPGPELVLVQCLPKGRKIDLIVRQATEAGVSRIVLAHSAHGVVSAGEDGNRMARLRRIAREALQQSGAAALPRIEEPRGLAELAAAENGWGTAIFFHEQPSGSSPLHRLLAHRPPRITLLIGPEGGLAAAEVDLLRAAGFQGACLGRTVLRVETAALYAIGAVRTIVQERDAWIPSQEK